uniref:Integrase, catalytic region, zinc finger, CCHC-type, peptidase aspartic, catalytic n=1 Tax=Tanacetum cinerariifolium TaxID=118510 RepID=A0A699J7C2_TANCI|nr:hypothetical protein [Tanacetum cinerariifolium]
MLKVNMEPIALRLLNNRTVHSDYLRLTQEQAVILREVVEHRKSQNPLNNSLEHACKYTKRIQELLILIRQTCPNINNSSDKLVAVTLKNKDKRVRFIKPITSLGNTNTKTSSSSNLVFDKPMLSSAGVKPSTSASGSHPSGNTKKNKIQRPTRITSPHSVDHPTPEVIAPIAKVVALEPVVSTVSPSSTTVNQDAPSPSNSQTTLETQSPVISNDVEEKNHDIDVAHINNDPFFGILILDNDFECSSSDVIPTIVHGTTPNSEHVTE